MPSLFKSKAKSEAKAKDDIPPQQPTHRTNDNNAQDVPPAYTAVQPGQNPTDAVDITAAFSSLNISPTPKDPTVDTCLAHLKLLYAVQSLKEDVGYTDGLWEIWDTRADGPDSDIEVDLPNTVNPNGSHADDNNNKDALTPSDLQKIRLSKIREKRWALFVARAVDRYEAWWNVFPKTMLTEADMTAGSGAKYHSHVSETAYLRWTEDMLPPLDVLMV